MGAFLEGPNRAAAFGTLAATVGISPGTFDKLKQAYEAGGKILVALFGKSDSPLVGGALITGTGAVVAVAAELVKALGLLEGGKSQFDILYDQIRADLKVIESAIAAASRHEDQKDLAEIASDAKTIEDVARRYIIQVDKLKTTEVPDKDAFVQAALQSEQLVGRCLQDALWQRLTDEKMIVQVTGVDPKRFAPVSESSDAGLVWDYRAALPVFIKAIHARLTYLAAKNPTYRDDNAQEIAAMADALTRVHDRIQSGIKLIPAPPPLAGQYQALLGFMPSSQWFAHVWAKWGSPCGAVDTYGGTGVVEKFPGTQPEWHVFYTDPVAFKQAGSIRFGRAVSDQDFAAQLAEGKTLRSKDQAYRRAFNLLFLSRSLPARKELEGRIGLPELRALVAKLRQLSRNRFATVAAPKGIGGSLRDIMSPSPEILAQLTPENWWYQSMSSADTSIEKGFAVPVLFGSTAALTTEFAQQFGTPPGAAAPKSLAAMVVGA